MAVLFAAIPTTDNFHLGRSCCLVSCYWWARTVCFCAVTLPICNQNSKTFTVLVAIHYFSWSSVSTSFCFLCKIPPAAELMEEYIVANYMVYAFLLVLMWRQQLVASYVASFEKEHGKGVAGRRKSLKSLASAQAELAGNWLVLQSCSSR